MGRLIDVTRRNGFYDYRIISGCRFTGRSSAPLRLLVGGDVRFAIKGRLLYVVDGDGKTQKTKYTLQEFMPPFLVIPAHPAILLDPLPVLSQDR